MSLAKKVLESYSEVSEVLSGKNIKFLLAESLNPLNTESGDIEVEEVEELDEESSIPMKFLIAMAKLDRKPANVRAKTLQYALENLIERLSDRANLKAELKAFSAHFLGVVQHGFEDIIDSNDGEVAEGKLANKVVEAYKVDEIKLPVGNDFESAKVRIHRFRDFVRVTDVVFAGKRGKKCREVSFEFENEDKSDAFVDMIKESMDFDDILEMANKLEGTTVYRVHKIRELKGVEVIPVGLKDFEFENDNFHIKATLKMFSISDLRDKNNEPRCISTSETGVNGTKKLYNWLNDNSDKIKNMTFGDIRRVISDDLKIKSHSYCAMD